MMKLVIGAILLLTSILSLVFSIEGVVPASIIGKYAVGAGVFIAAVFLASALEDESTARTVEAEE
jgi:hypothetical protein